MRNRGGGRENEREGERKTLRGTKEEGETGAEGEGERERTFTN
mgnify:CR=1 FL=1